MISSRARPSLLKLFPRRGSRSGTPPVASVLLWEASGCREAEGADVFTQINSISLDLFDTARGLDLPFQFPTSPLPSSTRAFFLSIAACLASSILVDPGDVPAFSVSSTTISALTRYLQSSSAPLALAGVHVHVVLVRDVLLVGDVGIHSFRAVPPANELEGSSRTRTIAMHDGSTREDAHRK